MKRRSFFTLLLGSNLLLIAIVLIVGAVIAFRAVSAQWATQSTAFQTDVLEYTAAMFEQAWPMREENVDRLCKSIGKDSDLRVTIIDANGLVLGDTQKDPAEMERHDTASRPEVMAALDGEDGSDIRRSETIGVDFRYFARPIRHGGRVVAVARVAVPVENIERSRELLRSAILWSFQLMLIAAFVLSLLLSWFWYRPLRAITSAAQDLALGDLDSKPEVHGCWELEQLAEVLDRMRKTVSSQLRTIGQQREGLRMILANLREAIIAVDATDQVVFMNETARDLFRVDVEADSSHVQSLVRHAAIVDLYHQATDTDRNVQRRVEVDLHGRRHTLEVDVTRISGEGDHEVNMLIVVRDVTDVLRTSQMKADFVANASHELRTPLATIRAALETLDDEMLDDPVMIRRILTMLDRHVGRLESMVNDLLDLHVVENESVPNRSELIELAELTDWLETHFEQPALDKDVRLVIDSAPADDLFLIDRKRLLLIVQNLVDNAIKFTPLDGEVRVALRREGRRLDIVVEDTGCGISPEDQTKVFDRFYQADSSRTGDNRIRGTGLGLAIVKHATDRLGGRVQLESELGVGTKVSVRVPVSFPADPNEMLAAETADA